MRCEGMKNVVLTGKIEGKRSTGEAETDIH